MNSDQSATLWGLKGKQPRAAGRRAARGAASVVFVPLMGVRLGYLDGVQPSRGLFASTCASQRGRAQAPGGDRLVAMERAVLGGSVQRRRRVGCRQRDWPIVA